MMKAMIFAAGLGTRLAPYTDSKPKALVEVGGKPLLEYLVINLKSQGITDIIINVHHYASQVIDFLKRKNNFDLNIAISNEEECLLDTGGGLVKASWFFADDKPFLVHNVDVFSDINFREMLCSHEKENVLASLAVSNRSTNRYFLFDGTQRLCGWENKITKEKRIVFQPESQFKELAFSGIHIISPEIFHLITQKGKFSITSTYLELASKYRIVAFQHDPNQWFDLGKPSQIEIAERLFASRGVK
jgi:N-acetyl-alpha-D-muramate 1-phosphate uridylyltransferase